MASINTRLSDKRLSLINEQCGRTMDISPEWKRLRIAIHASVNHTASYTNGPEFAFGLYSGTTNMYKDSTTAHFLGVRTVPDQPWTYATSYWNGVYFQSVLKVGESINAATPEHLALVPRIAKATSMRFVYLLDINKNGSIYTLRFGQGGYNSEAGTADFTRLLYTPNYIAYSVGWTAPVDITVDEATNGVFDTINVSWTGAEQLDISAIGSVILEDY